MGWEMEEKGGILAMSLSRATFEVNVLDFTSSQKVFWVQYETQEHATTSTETIMLLH
jgi:hypothetical protein